MNIQIKKWEDSIGLQIPPQIAIALGIDESSVVELTATEDTLTIRKKQTPLTLRELLDSIPEDFRYPNDIADFVQSEAVGREQL
jgi:antitoxin MazE